MKRLKITFTLKFFSAVELIYARCRALNIPKPIIVDTGDNDETLELRWTWQNAMKNCGERDNEGIRYPKQQPKNDKQDEIKKRSQSDIMTTLSRVLEVVNPESLIFRVVAELAKYADLDIVMMKKISQSQEDLSIQGKN